MRFKTIAVEATSAELAESLNDLDAGPVVLTQNGEPIAVITGLEGIDLEAISLSANPQFVALIERSRTRLKAEGGISSGEMRKRLGIE